MTEAVPELLDSLVKWSKAQGATIDPRLELKYKPENGVSAYYRPESDSPETTEFAIRIPTKMILTAKNARQFFEERRPGFRTDLPESVLFKAWLGYLLTEPKERQTPYFRLLPTAQEIRSPLTYNEQELRLLEGTNAYKGAELKLHQLKTQHADLVRDVILPEHVSRFPFEDYLWGHLILSSRAFPLKIVDSEAHPASVMLLPLVDLMNHEPMSSVTWGYDGANFTVDIKKTIDDSADEVEVCNNYGPKGNEELLLGYGFVIRENPFDCLQLSLGADTIKQLIGDCKLSDWGIEKLPKLNDYTFSIVSNVYEDPEEEGEEDYDDEFIVFMCNRDHPIPKGLLELFTLLSRNEGDTSPTMKSRLNGVNKLRESLASRFKGNLDRMPAAEGNNVDQFNYENCRLYREGQLHVYNVVKKALKEKERELLKEARKQLVTIKDIMRKDESFEPFVDAFQLDKDGSGDGSGLNKYEMELLVHLWLLKCVNYGDVPWVSREFAKAARKAPESDEFLEELYDEAIVPLLTAGETSPEVAEILRGDHWDKASFLHVDKVYRDNSYEKGKKQEPVIIEPK